MDSENKTRSSEKRITNYARRLACSQFVSRLSSSNGHSVCCGNKFSDLRELYCHVNAAHAHEISSATERLLAEGSEDAKWKVLRAKAATAKTDVTTCGPDATLPVRFNAEDQFPWLPHVTDAQLTTDHGPGRVLLFYHYCDIKNTAHVKEWQEALCKRLHLSGKIRVSSEGLNATVGGTIAATDLYMEAVLNHPLFRKLVPSDFKTSAGGSHCFPDGLRVGVFREAVPMGISPREVSYTNAGVHLTPAQFHQTVGDIIAGQNDAVLIDCRNFYESKIGRFEGAVDPDIRKFSYWPEYVDKNEELFRNKDVLMYCTGGIRCERGSAYLKSKDLCREVYQLQGGIHKYIEKYPDGFFKGKLFVFDDRYAIPANDEILSVCSYCGQPWDSYRPCSSSHCHQLVLTCQACRQLGRTTCCATCQWNDEQGHQHEQCDCTRKRARVPTATLPRMPSNQAEGVEPGVMAGQAGANDCQTCPEETTSKDGMVHEPLQKQCVE